MLIEMRGNYLGGGSYGRDCVKLDCWHVVLVGKRAAENDVKHLKVD